MKTLIAFALLALGLAAHDPHAVATFSTGALVILALGNRPNPPRNA